MIARLSTTSFFPGLPAFFTLWLCSAALAAPPQDPPIEWGEVPAADLAMKSFPADSNAAAVVLCDYGETTLSNSLELVFKRHTRIKILSASGYDWGNQSFVIHSRQHVEGADAIEGATYVLGDEGKVLRTEMDESAVFKEKADEYFTRYRFTLPALRPGCVIEFRYRIKTEAWNYIRDWVFQGRLPVLWSEYRVMMPHQVVFAAVSNKRFPFTVDEQTETSHSYSGDAALYVGRDMAKCYRYRWIVRDAPALVDEPYVTRVADYAQKMDLTLAAFAHWREFGAKTIALTWDDAINGLLEEEDFGKRMEVSSRVRGLADQITAGLRTPLEKTAALYDYVRKTIVWTGREGIYSSLGSDEVLDARKGSVSQIAFLLVSMLRGAGIESDPILLSPRSNGMIQTTYPVLQQFSSVIARATIDGTSYFMDATDPLRPFDMLPADDQRVSGLVIRKGPVEWVRIDSRRIYAHKSAAHVTLSEAGEIQGVLESSDEQYGALAKRRDLGDMKPLDFARKVFEADREGLTLDSVVVDGRDSTTQPLRVTARITSPSYAQASGDLIYINPAIVDRWTTNPFTSETRKYPVNMSYGRKNTSIVTIAIPAGFEIKEVPEDQKLRLGTDDAVFTRLVAADGPAVQVFTNFLLNRTDFPPASYGELRQFYERVTALESQQLVLRRKPPAVQKVQPAVKPKTVSRVKHGA
jgi:hypothetical protein